MQGLLGILLTGKRFVRVGSGNKNKGKGVVGAGYGNKNKGKGVLKAGYGNKLKNKVNFLINFCYRLIL